VVGLLIAGFVSAVLVLCAADRVLKARAQARRLRRFSDRLADAAARAEEQQEQRQAAVQASGSLTSVMPAIKRAPLLVPGKPSPGAARPETGCEPTGQGDHRSAHPGRRLSGTGEHAGLPADGPDGD
jgi:hypothetical protein